MAAGSAATCGRPLTRLGQARLSVLFIVPRVQRHPGTTKLRPESAEIFNRSGLGSAVGN